VDPEGATSSAAVMRDVARSEQHKADIMKLLVL
jgi:hypothetical protein